MPITAPSSNPYVARASPEINGSTQLSAPKMKPTTAPMKPPEVTLSTRISPSSIRSMGLVLFTAMLASFR
ncbi:MAG: hypothetical protein M3Q48_09865 [Actinomycetota bacterium]|nr:hypothetical protein [Actinomycetota bacterium]